MLGVLGLDLNGDILIVCGHGRLPDHRIACFVHLFSLGDLRSRHIWDSTTIFVLRLLLDWHLYLRVRRGFLLINTLLLLPTECAWLKIWVSMFDVLIWVLALELKRLGFLLSNLIRIDMVLSFLQALVWLLSRKTLRNSSLKSIQRRVLTIILHKFKLTVLVNLVDVEPGGVGGHVI